MRPLHSPTLRALLCALTSFALIAPGLPAQAAEPPVLASYPLFLAPPTPPNVLVLLDNSGSMDATMSGKIISGDDPSTRGNIARSVLRNIISTHRSGFNWGLGTFELSGSPTLWFTQAYFIGSASTMVYTNNCTVPLRSAPDTTGYSADGPQVVVSPPGATPIIYRPNCLQNPDRDAADAPRNGMQYLTFELSGDDAEINDVYYNSSSNPFLFGIGVPGSGGRPNRYNIYSGRDATTAWTAANFDAGACVFCPVDFTPTDAGWLPVAARYPRMVFVRRGWGYGSGISGRGTLVEPVVSSATGTPAEVAAEAAHHAALMAALAPESNEVTPEIKNAAYSTPLAGTVKTARDYFAGQFAGRLKSPIAQSCQKNYVVLATDGNPTGRFDGSQYDPSEWINTRDAGGNWIYGAAQTDVFAQVGTFDAAGVPTGGLRSTTLNGAYLGNGSLAGRRFDIKSYVIGLGDTVVNESSVAALNEMARLGGGYPQAFLGTTVQAVQDAFQTIVSNIQKQQGAAASVALSSGVLGTATSVYQSTFNSSDWSGDLKAFTVGAGGGVQNRPRWSAGVQLGLQDWNSGRSVLTAKPSAPVGAKGIAFRWPVDPAAPTSRELDVAQTAALNQRDNGVVDGQGAARLDFLRGDRSHEPAACPGCAVTFRDRGSPLGDLVDSAPVLVGGPSATFYDDIESGAAYSRFAADQRSRTRMLYVGANDGMLHGFDASSGQERLAFVPSPLYGALSALTSPAYGHRYYVDGTPSVGDVFYDGSWKTLLVSGLRAGGKGLFALDVTDPSTFSEANASRIVRWEFLPAQDADLGYVFSQPVLVKTNDGRWSVIVANGYNAGSASGHAVLFVIDAETGIVTKKIDTGAGSAASPNGLSGPAAVDTNGDNVADVVYAGDLNGNLWKFDLSAAAPAAWGVGNGGVALYKTDEVNPESGTRAITGRPNVTPFPQGGYMVVFGSGRYLSIADASNASPQTLYGVWDNGVGGSSVSQASLVRQVVVSTATGVDGALYRLTSHAIGDPVDHRGSDDAGLTLGQYYATRRGWFIELPTSGERSVYDARIRGGRAVFTTLIPNVSDPCAFGGSGWLMELDVTTGNRDDRGTFDTNSNAVVDGNDNIAFGGGGRDVPSGRFFDGIPAAPSTLAVPEVSTGGVRKPCTEIRYVPKSDGTTEAVVVACGRSGAGRAQWREVR